MYIGLDLGTSGLKGILIGEDQRSWPRPAPP
jgi:sugar (pentulose or hexulose) kinase